MLLRKVKATSGSYFGTNEESALYQRKAWSHGVGAMFVTYTPDDYSNILVSEWWINDRKNPCWGKTKSCRKSI